MDSKRCVIAARSGFVERKWKVLIVATFGTATLLGVIVASAAPPSQSGSNAEINRHALAMIDEGRKIFRYDTFGSEVFWGDTLQLHKAIAGEKNGGIGPGVSPKTALSVGLKVDADALPSALKKQLAAGKVNLDDPATTIALLKLNAVVGVTAFTNPDGSVKGMGIQCSFCHSTVDDSFAPGIGRRLDGWPNRDLNVGAIVSLAPNLKPFTDLLGVDTDTVKKVLATWGPGRFDAELNKDGNALRSDGKQAGTLIRHTVVRECPTPSATDFSKPLFTGISRISCLPLSPNVRYDPARLLGHILGQRGGRWRGKSIGSTLVQSRRSLKTGATRTAAGSISQSPRMVAGGGSYFIAGTASQPKSGSAQHVT